LISSLEASENLKTVRQKLPVFLHNYNFDASSFGLSFDYIIAHSIMSHAAEWQRTPYVLENCSKALKPGGKVIFSMYLTER